MIDRIMFTKQQRAAVDLIRNDLRLMTTIFANPTAIKANSVCAFLPYMGLIVDGVENWVKRFNNSSKEKLAMPLFDDEEKDLYTQMREAIKFWESPYPVVFRKLGQAYSASEEYFANCCKPIAKALKLYDVFGVDIINDKCCGNTILYGCYIPNYMYSDVKANGEKLYKLSMIAGKYVAAFEVTEKYPVSHATDMTTQNYGGLIKSPVGKSFSDNFVLLSMLGQINYLIQVIDGFIIPETTSKLRLAYLLYYDVLSILPEVNCKLSTSFAIDDRWESRLFRDSMAHYGIGVDLRCESDFVDDDPLYGLTQKYFDIDYYSLKAEMFTCLASLARQLEKYLRIDKGLFHF